MHPLDSPRPTQPGIATPQAPSGPLTQGSAPRASGGERLALGGVVGPAAFVGAWATGTVVLDGYSPIPDAISRLAAVGADTRWLMTAGFLTFSAAAIPAAAALRRAIPGRAWTGVLGTGLATALVAALPLDRSPAVDSAHGMAAAVGYGLFVFGAAAAAQPLLAAGHRRLGGLSLGVAALASASLALTPFVGPSGLMQRIGLTSLDCWLVAVSIAILTGRLDPQPPTVAT
ncbi:MAG: DUF998 domain-containing protein [Microthrixaceae bacterium]